MRTPNNANTIEQEINEIRFILYEKTKNMTSEEITEYYRKSGEATAQKYGFKIVENAQDIKIRRP
jgi:hypothetical protein